MPDAYSSSDTSSGLPFGTTYPAGGSASAAGAVPFLALLWPLLGPSLPLLGGSVRVLLDRAHPVWQVNLGPPQRAAYLIVESSLSHAADLAAGTAVANVRLVAAGGRSGGWTLRAGNETGEWAARRPDVARAASLPSPPAWSSWVAGDFFGQLYRSRWRLPWSGPFELLRVELAPGLPPDTALALHALELER
ncbi:MAG TPA: hypothetical protein VHR45_15350 [Thermoanaerobaculia bacterium]|nr:hypothetical protein [Thermoanaerobaculia bacterium]